MKRKLLASFVIVFVLFSTTSMSAWAEIFTVTLPDNLGTPGYGLNGGRLDYSITSPFASPAGANLTFDLVGYNSVDGSGAWVDTFTIIVNGNTLFSGGFNMGGSGSTFINSIAPGVTILSTSYFGPFASWGGGLTQFSVNHTLVSGTNTYSFDYGQMQGLGDEGWGLRSAVITATPVPEPASMLLIGAGIAALAGVRKLKKQQQPA